MAESKKYDVIICLGAVIRGATSHYDYVCAEVSKGIAQVSLQTGLPVMFGVLQLTRLTRRLNALEQKPEIKATTAPLEQLKW